jgi:hypothetical protein
VISGGSLIEIVVGIEILSEGILFLGVKEIYVSVENVIKEGNE